MVEKSHKELLLTELKLEAENTRKLFDAVPEDVLRYKPNDFNWTIAQLVAHIAQLYNWWDMTLNQDVLDVSTYHYDPGDISNMKSLRARMEENLSKAIQCMEVVPEEKLWDNWSMVNGDHVLMPPTSRILVMRGFLLNHLYHHRGELIAFLRVNKKRVPGLYGPAYEEQ